MNRNTQTTPRPRAHGENRGRAARRQHRKEERTLNTKRNLRIFLSQRPWAANHVKGKECTMKTRQNTTDRLGLVLACGRQHINTRRCRKPTPPHVLALAAVSWLFTAGSALANLPPIAEAGPHQNMYLGETATLQGSATDPDGDPIFGWEWQVISAPTDSNYSLALANTANAVFGTDMVGNYVITLRASDGLLWGDPDAMVVIVVENQSPVALIDAAPLSGPAPLLVSFDGTDSYDPEGEALLYNWYVDSTPIGNGATTDHEFQIVGTYEVRLKVTDEFGNIDYDTVDIIVTPGGNIQVSPEAYDFGDVELGSSSSAIITITNPLGGTYEDPLDLLDVSLLPGGSAAFAITDNPVGSIVVPGGWVDVGITFTPSAVGDASATLRITSDDPVFPLIEVSLGGTGVYDELPPDQQIAAILTFIENSVAAGTLAGDGPGNSAGNRLSALVNMIEAAGDLIEDGLYDGACGQLAAAAKKCDGQPNPPDFVTGPATPTLNTMIEALRTTLGCEGP